MIGDRLALATTTGKSAGGFSLIVDSPGVQSCLGQRIGPGSIDLFPVAMPGGGPAGQPWRVIGIFRETYVLGSAA